MKKISRVWYNFKFFWLRLFAAIGNIPITLWVLCMTGILLLLNREIPEWLIKRTEDAIKKREVLPEPFELV